MLDYDLASIRAAVARVLDSPNGHVKLPLNRMTSYLVRLAAADAVKEIGCYLATDDDWMHISIRSLPFSRN